MRYRAAFPASWKVTETLQTAWGINTAGLATKLSVQKFPGVARSLNASVCGLSRLTSCSGWDRIRFSLSIWSGPVVYAVDWVAMRTPAAPTTKFALLRRPAGAGQSSEGPAT